MKAGKYTFRELFDDREVEEIIIPEIQRDYVWTVHHVDNLLGSITQKYNDYKTALDKNIIDGHFTDTADRYVKKRYKEEYFKQHFSLNIGFIYAYFDSSYHGKFFLIDGQQRFTTIFLLLVYIAKSTKESDLIERFKKAYYASGDKVKLAYKVRDSSHTFINKFVNYIISKDDVSNHQEKEDDLDIIKKIKGLSWYLSNYDNDVTIQTVLKNYEKIMLYFKDKEDLVCECFYKYLTNHLEMWYFDTNYSKQGEYLYITMNSRGEELAKNENIKTSLLKKESNPQIKDKWGKKWEEWQNFFWRNRGKGRDKEENENADKGFNEFLCCISAFEKYKKEKGNKKSKGENNKKNDSQLLFHILTNLKFEIIQKYMDGFQFIIDNATSMKRIYRYTPDDVVWIDKLVDEMWKIFNGKTTEWFLDDKGKKEKVFIWSIFEYLKEYRNKKELIEIVRLLRLYYVRYMNGNMAEDSILKRVEEAGKRVFGENTKFDQEERAKHKFYNILKNQIEEEDHNEEARILYQTENYPCNTPKYHCYKVLYLQEELKQIEKIIWKIEDHPYNIDGSNLDSVNLTHLINLDDNPTKEDLINIRYKFYTLFPLEESKPEKNRPELQSLLLYYGDYWKDKSSQSYKKYQCNEWRRIIRGSVFKKFFKEFESHKDIDFLLKEKKYIFLQGKNIRNIFKIKDEREQVIIYTLLSGNIWKKGGYIAFDYHYNEDKVRVFEKEKKIYNSSGNLNSKIELRDKYKDYKSSLSDLIYGSYCSACFGI